VGLVRRRTLITGAPSALLKGDPRTTALARFGRTFSREESACLLWKNKSALAERGGRGICTTYFTSGSYLRKKRDGTKRSRVISSQPITGPRSIPA